MTGVTIRNFTADQLNQVRQLLKTTTGLLIFNRKDKELAAKLAPIAAGYPSTEIFLSTLKKNTVLRERVTNALTIGESYFFRNHPHFNALREKIIPDILAHKGEKEPLRIWSAGSSTGEEPYSLAMLIHRQFSHLWPNRVEIVATDINSDYLAKAQEGLYTAWSFRGVDDRDKRDYFIEHNVNRYGIRNFIKRQVRFAQLNLIALDRGIPPQGYSDFDLILCRNVLIYFTNELARRICEGFSEALRPHGYLILGHSESFPDLARMDTIYSHATYYYRRNDLRTNQVRHSHSLVPGIGDFNPKKMITPTAVSLPGIPKRPTTEEPTPMFQAITPPPPTPAPIKQSDPELGLAIEADLKVARDLTIDGELDKANALLTKLEATCGRLDYRIHFLQALVADQRSDLDDSLSHLRQALFINKKFAVGHYYQGVIAERTGNTALATRSYRNVVLLAKELPINAELPEGGGITAGRIAEIAIERQKELEM